ncbi:hypothetical protein [Ekhidna sp. To15]|uniref:hypothetical protein n=1 Tax=Ekhidna sp. To15 TaxID=3395267 RepID=UPI003F51EB19
MKKQFTLLSLLFFVASLAMAQNFDAPKRGAKIYAQEYTIDVSTDSDTSFDLWIVRSKFAKRANFSAPKMITNSGLAFDVKQDDQNKDHFIVTVSANKVAAGQYSTTVSSRSTGTQKVTGTTLSFNVTTGKAVASKDGE